MHCQRVSRLRWAVLAALLAACSQPGPDFTVALGESSVSAPAGGTATLSLTLTPRGGFTGNVDLTLEARDGTQAPAGLSLSPTTVGLTSGSTTQTLTLRVGGSVAVGTYPLRVRATAGSLSSTADFTLTVGASPGFEINVSPNSLSVRQGGSATLELTVTPQNGFGGSVNLALEQRDGSPVPSRLTYTPTSVTVNANPTRVFLTLNAATDLAPGPYRLRLRASQGSLTRTADFDLTVEASARVSLTVVDGSRRGYAVAYQVGTGGWRTFEPNTDHIYVFDLGAATTYGVAVRCGSGSETQIFIIQAHYRELPNPRVVCSTLTPTLVNYSVEVDVSSVMVDGSVVEGDAVTVHDWQGGSNRGVVPLDGRVTVPLSLPQGSRDLLVTVGTPGNALPKLARALRSVDVRNGATDSWELKASDIEPAYKVTVGYPAGCTPLFSVVYWLSRDNQGGGLVGATTLADPYDYRSVAGNGPGDRYLALAVARNDTGNAILGVKGSGVAMNLSLHLPPPWSTAPVFTDEAHPYVQGLSYSHSDLYAYYLDLTGPSLNYRITITRRWLGGGDEYKVPNLAATLGYTPFAPGDTITTSVEALLSPNDPPPLTFSFRDLATVMADTEVYAVEYRGTYTVR